MGKFVQVLKRSSKLLCWNCKHPLHELTNKPSHLGREWGLICDKCGKDLTEWYLLRGFVRVVDVIKAETKARIKHAYSLGAKQRPNV